MAGGGLGRALIRQPNKAAPAAKERSEAIAFALRRAMPLQSVINASDIDTVLQLAAEADQLAEAASVSSDSVSDHAVDLDATGEMDEERQRQKEQEALQFTMAYPDGRLVVEDLDAK